MKGEREPEDLAALDVLDQLASPGDPALHGEDTGPMRQPLTGEDAEAVEVLRRLYVESVGLVAYGLEPVSPRAETRTRLLMAVAGDETQEVQPITEAPARAVAPPPSPVVPVPPAVERPRAAPPAVSAPAAPGPLRPSEPVIDAGPILRERTAPVAPRESASRRRSRWPAALAALFALAAIGLGVWAAMLYSEVAYRDAQIRRLEGEVAGSAKVEEELAAAKQAIARLEERVTFVTAPSTTVFALRPPETAPQPLARGHLYLAANRRDFRLEVRGLAPETESQDYQLWFIVDGIPMNGGVFDAELGQVAGLAASTMPQGVTAVAITLEKKGGVTAPTTPILLIADQTVQI